MKKWIAGFCILVCILIAAEIYRELHTFQVTHYTVTDSKQNRPKMKKNYVFLSDLHNHVYGDKNEKLLAEIRSQNPDVILIGGDMLVGKEQVGYTPALEFVSALCEICPVYYANGNHEQRMKEKPEKYENAYKDYKKALAASGVHFLENESTEILSGEERVRISGLELPMETYEKLKKHKVKAEDVKDALGAADKNSFQILLAHNPEYCDAYLEWGADLILCGHLHGGLICLPNGRSVITPQFHLFPKYAGEMTVKNGQTVVVSRGLGTHTVNIRLFNPAEVVVLHL